MLVTMWGVDLAIDVDIVEAKIARLAQVSGNVEFLCSLMIVN